MPDYEVLVVGRSCVYHIAVVASFPRENAKIDHRSGAKNQAVTPEEI